MNIAQMALLSICNEMDVKGTMSGKLSLFKSENKAPNDILGHMLIRLGYTVDLQHQYGSWRRRDGTTGYGEYYYEYVTSPEGVRDFAYHVAQRELSIAKISDIYHEIDRTESTNETIRKKIREICHIS